MKFTFVDHSGDNVVVEVRDGLIRDRYIVDVKSDDYPNKVILHFEKTKTTSILFELLKVLNENNLLT